LASFFQNTKFHCILGCITHVFLLLTIDVRTRI
jgi:hypothetical protein